VSPTAPSTGEAALGTAVPWISVRPVVLQRATTAFLQSALRGADDPWSPLRTDLQDDTRPLGRLGSR
jgi:hypothetical protein